jgi:pimeloyl-ACP methyl ester carboxylesterase
MGETVVYVHGLWFSGHEAFLLQRHVQEERGYGWQLFPYASTQQSMAEVADALDACIRALAAPTVHLVGHSLGGIVIQRCLERHPDQPPGRVVLLGTPSLPSRAAATLARFPFGSALLGEAEAELLHSHAREWRHPRELGIIAGSLQFGLGQLLARFDGPNDGTVSVEETRLPGASAHIVLPVSHTGLLLSKQVAHELCQFLATGHFGD